MKSIWKSNYPYLVILLLLSLSSCNKEAIINPPVKVQFEKSAITVGKDEQETSAKLTFSKPLSENATITLKVEGKDLEYGKEYSTDPEVLNGKIMLSVAKGETDAIIKVFKKENFEKEKKITLSILVIAGEDQLKTGDNSTFNILFSSKKKEDLGKSSGEPIIEMGGDQEPNQVYIDLSTGEMTPLDRFSWDLGFYNKDDDFFVKVNGGGHVFAKPINKNLASITETDITLFKDKMVPGFSYPEAVDWTDHHEGAFDKAAIGVIPANQADAKNYILAVVNQGTNEHYKIRITQNGSGYKLEYAKVSESTTKTIEITKDAGYAFTYINVKTGKIVNERPKKWDLLFTQQMVSYPMGAQKVPYQYKDYLLQNYTQGVQTAIIDGKAGYKDFAKDDASTLTFNDKANGIGSSWRNAMSKQLKDKFYIVKDHEGNLYKMKFEYFIDPTTNERGHIKFKYEKL